ncbi:SPOR domain-containing protein [Candidatus Omnitrophota bacterium]
MGAKFQDRKEKDLFDQLQTFDKKRAKLPGLFLSRLKKSVTLSYENVIFVSIGFVMSCVIFFSLGVEKGRLDVNRAKEQKQAIGVKKDRGGALAGDPVEDVFEEKRKSDVYIIDLAAFRKKESAEEEMNRLKREGHDAGVRKSGQYYQLFISGFNKKASAQKLLKKMKERYEDCYIKKTL